MDRLDLISFWVDYCRKLAALFAEDHGGKAAESLQELLQMNVNAAAPWCLPTASLWAVRTWTRFRKPLKAAKRLSASTPFQELAKAIFGEDCGAFYCLNAAAEKNGRKVGMPLGERPQTVQLVE